MATINEYNIYLASWEYMYLLPNGVPAGLPNQLFYHHPWVLILFENLYCDENGFKAEQNAAEQLKWTISELIVKLASTKYDIIKPLNLESPLRPYIHRVETEFKKKYHSSVTKAISKDTVSVKELFQWRLKLLNHFLDQHKLILYDWPIARYEREIPEALKMAVKDVLQLEAAAIPLAKNIELELSQERKKIFDSLQEYEREPLRMLRTGRLSQAEYLEILKKRINEYHEVDIELVKDIDTNLERIMRLRERFGSKKGWQLVREYLKANDRGATPRELDEISKELRNRLHKCFKPSLKEFGPALWKITKGIVSFLPLIGEAKIVSEMSEPVKKIKGLFSEMIQFYRGQIRRRKK